MIAVFRFQPCGRRRAGEAADRTDRRANRINVIDPASRSRASGGRSDRPVGHASSVARKDFWASFQNGGARRPGPVGMAAHELGRLVQTELGKQLGQRAEMVLHHGRGNSGVGLDWRDESSVRLVGGRNRRARRAVGAVLRCRICPTSVRHAPMGPAGRLEYNGPGRKRAPAMKSPRRSPYRISAEGGCRAPGSLFSDMRRAPSSELGWPRLRRLLPSPVLWRCGLPSAPLLDFGWFTA